MFYFDVTREKEMFPSFGFTAVDKVPLCSKL